MLEELDDEPDEEVEEEPLEEEELEDDESDEDPPEAAGVVEDEADRLSVR